MVADNTTLQRITLDFFTVRDGVHHVIQHASVEEERASLRNRILQRIRLGAHSMQQERHHTRRD